MDPRSVSIMNRVSMRIERNLDWMGEMGIFGETIDWRVHLLMFSDECL
jgi:5-methylcytosine-specific restriction endonuclease McrBC GTP-binding regulatory subunit McrB